MEIRKAIDDIGVKNVNEKKLISKLIERKEKPKKRSYLDFFEYLCAFLCVFAVASAVFLYYSEIKDIEIVRNKMFFYGFSFFLVSLFFVNRVKIDFIKYFLISLNLFGQWFILGSLYNDLGQGAKSAGIASVLLFVASVFVIKSNFFKLVSSVFMCVYLSAYILLQRSLYAPDIICSISFVSSLIIFLFPPRKIDLRSLLFVLLLVPPMLFIYHDYAGVNSILWVYEKEMLFSRAVGAIVCFSCVLFVKRQDLQLMEYFVLTSLIVMIAMFLPIGFISAFLCFAFSYFLRNIYYLFISIGLFSYLTYEFLTNENYDYILGHSALLTLGVMLLLLSFIKRRKLWIIKKLGYFHS